MSTDGTVRFVDVVLSWRRSRGTGRTAVLRRPEPGAAWIEIGRTDGSEYVIAGVHPEIPHEWAAAEVLEDGSLVPESEWELLRHTPLAAAGRPERPATPTGLAASVEGEWLHVRWDPPIDGWTDTYELRSGPSWESGRLVAAGLPAARYSWQWWASGTATLWLRAIDVHGRCSTGAATAVVEIPALGTYVTVATADESGGGWAATKTDVEVDGSGDLRLSALPEPFGALTMPFGSLTMPVLALYRRSGTYETAVVNAGQIETQRIEVDVEAEQPLAALPFGRMRFSLLGRRRRRDDTVVRLGTRSWCQRQTWDGVALDAPDVLVEIDTSQSAAGAWEGYRPWVPGSYTCWRYRLRLTLRGDGFRNLKLGRLVVRRRKLNRKDEGRVALAGGAPVLVKFAQPFTAAPVVTATLEGASLFAGSKIVVTGVTKLQCHVEVFDGAGTSVAADLGWHAMGV